MYDYQYITLIMAHSENLVFKPYDPAQSTFLPPNLGQLIPATHQVRFISGVIDRLNIDELLAGYKGGGTSAYHPRMMLKILIYGYVQRIYTCRDLAKASRENIHFMWLTGGQQPNFRTINLFRKSRLRGTLKELYTQVMELLVEQRLVDLNDYFLDGSIVQANARKHSAVWAKNTERWEASVREQIGELFEQIQKIADVEDQEYGDGDLQETGHASQWGSEQMDEAARKLNETLSAQKDTPGRSKATRILSKLVKEKLPRLKGYEQQKRLLGRRKSYSKTDPDATFMKGKDQPVFSRDLRPAYNIQLGTQNQFILGYGVHQSPSDKSHLREHIDGLFFRPGSVIADGGYGSLANYEWLNEKGIRAQVKYPGYDRKPSAYSPEQMVYDEKEDTYRCPQGRTLHYDSERLYRYGDGQLTPVHRYRCESFR